MIEFLLLDLDDTIFDFRKAEAIALTKTLEEYGIPPTEETVSLYSDINQRHWEMLERGEIDREQVKVLRFARLFEQLGVDADALRVADRYRENLAIGHHFLPGAEGALEVLSKKYRLFITSNGASKVQAGRMTSANLYRFFEKTFVSEDMGADKPSAAYFEGVFSQIPGFDRARAMIVGDSLTSDIRGGINVGIATCWVNPRHATAPDHLKPDHEIEAIHQLPALLECLEK